jgi:hypothetical protein
MTLSELETIVRKHMLLADARIIKLLPAFVMAARLPINPPWLFIVGPPSGGKSQMLKSLEGCRGMFKIDDLTATTFISGMPNRNGESTSLLERLVPNSILLFKDWTTIISKEGESQSIVIGQMRKIYDGDISKSYGNTKQVNWVGKLSVLAGVTEKIHSSMEMFADMGERFLMFDFAQLDSIQGRKDVGRRAADNMDDSIAIGEMKPAFTDFIDNLKIPETLPVVDETTKEQIIDLAEFVTRARTPVLREKYNKEKPIIQVYKPERTPRFIKQVLGLAMGLQVVNGGPLTDYDRHILSSIALDSIQNIRRLCLKALTEYDQVETAALAVHLGYPTESLKMHLQNLATLNVVEFRKSRHGKDRWRLLDEYRVIMTEHDNIKQIGDIMEEQVPAIEEVPPIVEEISYDTPTSP